MCGCGSGCRFYKSEDMLRDRFEVCLCVDAMESILLVGMILL